MALQAPLLLDRHLLQLEAAVTDWFERDASHHVAGLNGAEMGPERVILQFLPTQREPEWLA